MALSATQIIEIPELPAMVTLAGNDLFATHSVSNGTTYKTTTFQISAFVRNAVSVDTAGLQLAGPIRLPAGSAITVSTTDDPLFVGVANSYNLVANSGSIQARNNGAVSTLTINALGGNVNIGNAGYTTSISGNTFCSDLSCPNASFTYLSGALCTFIEVNADAVYAETAIIAALSAISLSATDAMITSLTAADITVTGDGITFPDNTQQSTAAGSIQWLSAAYTITITLSNASFYPHSVPVVPTNAKALIIQFSVAHTSGGSVGNYTQTRLKPTAGSSMYFYGLYVSVGDGNQSPGQYAQGHFPCTVESGVTTIYIQHLHATPYGYPTVQVVGYLT